MIQIRFEGLRLSALSALARSPVALGVVVEEGSTHGIRSIDQGQAGGYGLPQNVH